MRDVIEKWLDSLPAVLAGAVVAVLCTLFIYLPMMRNASAEEPKNKVTFHDWGTLDIDKTRPTSFTIGNASTSSITLVNTSIPTSVNAVLDAGTHEYVASPPVVRFVSHRDIIFETGGEARVWIDGAGVLRYNNSEVITRHDFRELDERLTYVPFIMAICGVFVGAALLSIARKILLHMYLARQPKPDSHPYRVGVPDYTDHIKS